MNRRNAHGSGIALARRYGIWAFLVLALLLALFCAPDRYWSAVYTRVACSCILAAGLDLLTGLTNQVSMGCAAFMGIGAYAGSIICAGKSGFASIIAGLCMAVLSAALISLVVGYPLLRLQGDYLALATLGFGEVTRVLFENLQITGGAKGLFGIPHYSTAGLAFVFLAVSLPVACFFGRSTTGLFCRAVAGDESAAQSCGINTTRTKVAAFCACGVLCGLAGFLYAGMVGFIGPSEFGYAKSVDVLAAVILGGRGTLIGPVLAAAALELLTVSLQGFSQIKMILFALVLITAALLRYRDRKQMAG